MLPRIAATGRLSIRLGAPECVRRRWRHVDDADQNFERIHRHHKVGFEILPAARVPCGARLLPCISVRRLAPGCGTVYVCIGCGQRFALPGWKAGTRGSQAHGVR